MTPAALRDFINGLELPTDAKRRLLALTPRTYTGNAAAQARRKR
jgi:adenylosuccinate lyase